MKLSSEGLRLVKSFEGYHTKLPDGGCKAYRCPAGVWTCGFGCTEGVTANTQWTEAEATERLATEIAKFEAAVLRHVTVPLNQNQFDALVSFAYNCGEGALKKSTLLKFVNKEQWEKAAKQFPRWNRGGGRVLPGLVARRAREAALFMKPVEKPDEPYMPQAVEPPATVFAPVAVGGTVAVGTGAGAAAGVIPVPPVEAIGILSAWQSAGEQTKNFITSPLLFWIIGGLVTYWLVCHVLPKYAGKNT